MGRPFLEHMGGRRYYTCVNCKTYLASKKEVVSQTFRGATGQAYLFRNVVNINVARVESRYMITGRHMVRDVFCKCCFSKLGWMYEFANEINQTYKEGHVILEKKLMEEIEVKGELAKNDKDRPLTRTNSTSSMSSSSGISSVTIT